MADVQTLGKGAEGQELDFVFVSEAATLSASTGDVGTDYIYCADIARNGGAGFLLHKRHVHRDMRAMISSDKDRLWSIGHFRMRSDILLVSVYLKPQIHVGRRVL